MAQPVSAPSQFNVVLTYNGSDHDAVVAIYNDLKRGGFTPWIDSHDQRPGADWRQGFSAALKDASAVIVFFGPNGTGPWQKQEIPAIHAQSVESGVNVIPVVLPGGEIPDDLLFKGKAPVEFNNYPSYRDALDKLVFGITGRNPKCGRGRFEILAEVVNAEPNCFLAVSHATSRDIYEVMLEAAADADLAVKQPRELAPDSHNVYVPDVVVAIRSATVILADGTPHPQTNKSDADVMYEIGLAKAFAKPIILVSTPPSSALPLPIFVCKENCSRIEYDPDEVNVTGPLREKLANRLRDILQEMRPPHLVPDNNLGLSVAYSEMHRHRAVFWQPFEQIIHYGLTIKRVFAVILKHVHKMQHIIDLARANAVEVEPLADIEVPLDGFNDAYVQFCEQHVNHIEKTEIWRPAKTEAAKGFGVLDAISEETQGEDGPIQPIVKKARRFYEIVDTYLDEYLNAHDALLSRIKTPADRPLHQVIHLHSTVEQLARTAELVPANALEMMSKLLELIGMRCESGGRSDADDARTT